MIGSFFTTYLHNPIYNLLIFLIGVIPGGDVGVAVIAVTLVVRIVLLPVSVSAVRTQRATQVIQPELKALNERLKDKPDERAKETFALYRKYDIHPFAPLLLLIIQLPILLALYWVFRGETLPHIEVDALYSFVAIPSHISTLFLGVFTVIGKSLPLALGAGITQYFQARFAIPTPPKSEKTSMSEDFGRAMALQARFVIPFIIALVAYETSGAVALYFITTNLVTLFQEVLVRRKKVAPVAE